MEKTIEQKMYEMPGKFWPRTGRKISDWYEKNENFMYNLRECLFGATIALYGINALQEISTGRYKKAMVDLIVTSVFTAVGTLNSKDRNQTPQLNSGEGN